MFSDIAKEVYAARKVLSVQGCSGGGFCQRRASQIGRFLEGSLIILIVLAVWEIAPRIGLIDPFLLSPFSEVVAALGKLMRTGEFFKHFSISMFRLGVGFFSGLAIAIPLGVVMGWCRKFEQLVDPLVQACRNSSVLALYPIFILLFGIGERAKIAVIIWGTLWVVLLNTISGVKNVDPLLVKAARSMGIKDFALLRKILLPAALPSVITGIRLGAAGAVLVLIAAEMVGASAGLGFMIFYFEARYAVPEMYGGIIVLSTLGVLVNTLLFHWEKRITLWQEKAVKE